MVEVMAAMVLATVVMAASISFLSFEKWTSDALTRRMTAISLAKNRLEYLKRVPFSEMSYYAENDVRINAEGVPDETGRYLRSVVVGAESFATRPVDITVCSPGQLGRPDVLVPLSTIIRDPETLEN